MKTTGFPKPINSTQEQFHTLCNLSGGIKGGPARSKVLSLLKDSGRKLNEAMAYDDVENYLKVYSDYNPWHVCFAIGLCWGHLADMNHDFVGAAARALAKLNANDVAEAKKHHYERGPDPIEQSLIGGYSLFSKVKLPDSLPSDLKSIGRAQERWLSPILSKDRPKYIGSWNATAMFMVALFAQRKLADTMKSSEFMLPPGGPIYAALGLLHKAHLLSKPPEGTELDDESFQPGSIYLNNSLMVELRSSDNDLSLVDLHSGLYMLGTRFAPSNGWF